MQPFSITLFATSGDPEGIRHLDKSNWSGYGVVFNKELFHLLKQEPGFSQAGIYILVGNAAEETIYIGEADPVGDRLKNHVSNKEGWVWGVYFFDRNHKIGKTEVQYLESALVALAKKHDRAILLNKNNPTAPTMAHGYHFLYQGVAICCGGRKASRSTPHRATVCSVPTASRSRAVAHPRPDRTPSASATMMSLRPSASKSPSVKSAGLTPDFGTG